MTKLARMQSFWKEIYDPKKDVLSVIEEYLHPEYLQCINGHTMTRGEYIDHVIEQKKNLTISAIEYAQHIENDEGLFALYYPKGKNKAGSPVEAEVICFFQFSDEKIIKIHGQVRLLKGAFSDVDMQNN